MFPGQAFYQTRFVSREPSTSNGRTRLPVRFATEEQGARGKWQAVDVMHISRHVTSYEIFVEEVDGDEGGGGGKGGNSSVKQGYGS